MKKKGRIEQKNKERIENYKNFIEICQRQKKRNITSISRT